MIVQIPTYPHAYAVSGGDRELERSLDRGATLCSPHAHVHVHVHVHMCTALGGSRATPVVFTISTRVSFFTSPLFCSGLHHCRITVRVLELLASLFS